MGAAHKKWAPLLLDSSKPSRVFICVTSFEYSGLTRFEAWLVYGPETNGHVEEKAKVAVDKSHIEES